MTQIFSQYLLVVIAPLLEVYGLHRAVHAAYGPNNTALGIHATDFYIPLGLGSLIVFAILQKKSPLTILLRRNVLVFNLVLFFFSLSQFYYHTAFSGIIRAAEVRTFCQLFFSVGTLFSSAFLFISPAEVIQKIRLYPVRFLTGQIAVFCLFIYPHVLEFFWMPLAKATAIGAALALKGVGVKTETFVRQGIFQVWNPNFSASMVMGCSGLEGIFFFIFVALLMQMMSPSLFKRVSLFWVYLSGISLMFILNVFRLFSFFLIALYLERHLAPQEGRQFYEWVVHANIGWVLYFSALFFFFRFFHRKNLTPLENQI